MFFSSILKKTLPPEESKLFTKWLAKVEVAYSLLTVSELY